MKRIEEKQKKKKNSTFLWLVSVDYGWPKSLVILSSIYAFFSSSSSLLLAVAFAVHMFCAFLFSFRWSFDFFLLEFELAVDFIQPEGRPSDVCVVLVGADQMQPWNSWQMKWKWATCVLQYLPVSVCV